MAICLICSCFKTCIGCPLQSLMKHSKEYHGGSSVFIQVNNGSAFYISFDRMWLFPSLYENYRCFPYRSLAEVLYRCEFYLNESAFKNVLKDIMEYRIEQVIRVQEKKQGQVMIVPANRNGQNIV